MANINRQIAEELGIREQQVEATVALLDGGATVPFVARYRKEITGALDDAQLRTLEERLNYLRELEERRVAILEFRPRAGQARRRAGGGHSGGRQQGPPGRHLSAVQAEAPHQGRDRQGGGPGAARRPAADAAGKRAAGRGRAASSTPTSRWPTSRPRSTARAPFWSSASPRTPT